MVSSDVVVEKASSEEASQMKLGEILGAQTGTRAEACVATPDTSTYVDELFVMTVGRWLRT